MTKKQRQEVLGKLDWEGGYDYFVDGSDFSEVRDKKFHKLRKAIVDSHNAMHEYLGELEYDDESV